MRIAFVNLDAVSFDPPLGLAYMASYLRKYGNYSDIIIVDKEEPMGKLKKFKPDIVAFTSMSYEFHKVNDFAGKVKKAFGVPLIIGGYHISFMPNHLKESNFDIGVVGEGEQTMLELMNLYRESGGFPEEGLRKIDGIVFGDNIMTGKRVQIRDLDAIPFPARDLLNMKNFYLFPRRNMEPDDIGIYAQMFTSRGCPYKCTYCAGTKLWDGVRFNSAQYVVSEIREICSKYRIDGIIFWDDLFIANKKRVKEISELIRKEKLDRLKYSVIARANLLDDEICSYLKDMNVRSVIFGLESGSEKILKSIKKNTVTVEQNKKALELCKKYGFRAGGCFIIGCPGETEEDVMQTKELIENRNLDFGFLFQMTPLPGTEVWEYAKGKGLVSDDFNFNLDNTSLGLKKNMLLTDGISEERFESLFDSLSAGIGKKSAGFPKPRLKYIKYLFLPSVIRRFTAALRRK